jgi:iron complex transport system substrate-binding protein
LRLGLLIFGRTIVRKRKAAILLIALNLCLGCEQRAPVNQSVELQNFTDGIGRQIAVKTKPQRIISLAPNVTEILFALGLGDRVIGVTTYCDFPDQAKTKEKIGDTLHPNLERIIALKLELVVVTTSSQLENLARKLDGLQIPVYVANPRTIRDVIISIRELGKVTGATAEADKLADEMGERIVQVELRVKNLPTPSVFYVLQTGPLITAGRNTFINDLITLAGWQSISSEETADYPQFSRETVIARAPEIIVVPAGHGTDLVRVEDLRRDFPTTPAVRNNRIVRVNPGWVDRPGPRIVDGLELLARGLHPTSH